MKIFAVNTIVHREHQPVAFSVGDALPEWAEALVGDHCLTQEAAEAAADGDEHSGDAESTSDESEVEPEASTAEEAAEAEAVDFTKPARRTAAPKK